MKRIRCLPMPAVLSLVAVMSLSGCASAPPVSSETQRLPRLSGVLDVQSWLSDTERLSTELNRLLSSAPQSSSE